VKKVFVLSLAAASLGMLASCSRSAQYYVESGNKKFTERKFDDAALDYKKAIQKQPNLGEAYYRLGLLELERNNGVPAYEALQRAAELMPANTEVKAKFADVLVTVYLADTRRPQALYDRIGKLSDEFLSQDPNSFDGLRMKGYLALTDRKVKEAVDFFRKAVAVRPMEPVATTALIECLFHDKQFAEGEKLALELIEKHKTHLPVYDAMYRRYLAGGRDAEIEALLKKKINNNPKDIDSRLQFAGHWWRMKRPDEMKKVLGEILANPADFPNAWLRAGDFYANIGDPEEAIRQYQAGERGNPPEKATYQKRQARILAAQRKRDEAIRLLAEVLKASAADQEALTLHATLLLESARREDIETAAREFQALVDRNQDNAVLRTNLGQALQQKGDLEQARIQFLEAIRRQQNYLPPKLFVARIALLQQRYPEALQYASEILVARPRDPAARLVRATALMGNRDFRNARRELDRLVAEYPAFVDAKLQMGLLEINERQFRNADQIFQQLYKPGQPDIRPLRGLVETQIEQKQFERALQLLNEELKKVPDSIEVRLALASSALRTDRTELAIEQFKKLLEKYPDSVDLWLRLGAVYSGRAKDIQSAVASYEKGRAAAPKDPRPVMALALTMQNSGRIPEAIAHYRQALVLAPKDAGVQNNLAFLLAESGGNLQEAFRLAQSALAQRPTEPAIQDTVGWIYLKQGMTDSALQIFENIVKRNQTEAGYHYHLAAALLKKGDTQRARSAAQAALANNPAPDLEPKVRELLTQIK
jgi:tetratricopeptide (TPR) repeat protein